jgi:hypothetical protein
MNGNAEAVSARQIDPICAPQLMSAKGHCAAQNEHLFVSESRGAAPDAMQERDLQLGELPCARLGFLSRRGHYRLAGGRFKDALAAPLRGRAAPGP